MNHEIVKTSITGKKFVNVGLDEQQLEVIIGALQIRENECRDWCNEDGDREAKVAADTREQMVTAIRCIELDRIENN